MLAQLEPSQATAPHQLELQHTPKRHSSAPQGSGAAAEVAAHAAALLPREEAELAMLKEKLCAMAASIRPTICRPRNGDVQLMEQLGIHVPDWKSVRAPKRDAAAALGHQQLLHQQLLQQPQMPPTSNHDLLQAMGIAQPRGELHSSAALLSSLPGLPQISIASGPLLHGAHQHLPFSQAASQSLQQQLLPPAHGAHSRALAINQQQLQQHFLPGHSQPFPLQAHQLPPGLQQHFQHFPQQQQQGGRGPPLPPQGQPPKSNRAVKAKANGAGRTYTSKFRGVHQTFPTKRWEAQFRRNGKPTSLGCFDREDQAARAYDKMMLWCELHNTTGAKGGITNYDKAEYAEEIPYLSAVSQDQLITEQRTEGRRQANERQMQMKRSGGNKGGGRKGRANSASTSDAMDS